MSISPKFLSRDQVRSIDHRAINEYGIPGMLLMENAGRGAADLLMEQGINGPVSICTGKGNNGGDGFVMARHLEAAGHDVQVLLFSNPQDLTGDAKANYQILDRAGTATRALWRTEQDLPELPQILGAADWVVDALLGTGIQGPVREPFDRVISAINESAGKVFAVDLPSGLDCDTGRPLGQCIQATITGTFVAQKQGFAEASSQDFTGEVRVLPIGIPASLMKDFDL